MSVSTVVTGAPQLMWAVSTLDREVYAVHLICGGAGMAQGPAGGGRAAGGRRPKGVVRGGLVQAGIELARAGGPDAVTLREATRIVGVAPNAAYRHFADRDALLNAVCV